LISGETGSRTASGQSEKFNSGSFGFLGMEEQAILNRIDEITEDTKLVAELKKELSKDKALKEMLGVFELDEVARINPIEIYNALENKKLSEGAEEFRELCFRLADSAHAEAARQRKGLGGGED